MHQTVKLQKMATTKGGMRRMLKKPISPLEFIRQAVNSGVHKSLHKNIPYHERQQNGNNYKYPEEYEILSLYPPPPKPPRVTRKDLRRSKAQLPTDKLAKSYMRRYDARMKCSRDITEREKEEYYYRKTLGVNGSSGGMDTAMGRKSAVMTHAYDFAMKQFEVMYKNEGMTEEESIAAVEDILANEEKDERMLSRKKADEVSKEREQQIKEAAEASGVASDASASSSAETESIPEPRLPRSTVPSILHSKPRTIQALNIWGQRLAAIPYNQWSLGASTALDHWIAVDVLGMSESTWDRLLEGELESDIEASRGVDVNIGDLARAKDIVDVRSTLFPETVINHQGEADMMQTKADLEDNRDATERSIDELLASLGGYDEEDDEEESGGADDSVESSDDNDDRMIKMIDSLQDWRAKNEETPFESWDLSTKEEFNGWMSEYLTLMDANNGQAIDVAATRDALLSEPPRYREESDPFWKTLSDETNAEIFLDQLIKQGVPPAVEGESPAQKKNRLATETFLNMPYTRQLRQLINFGALRPILDEYSTDSMRQKFMEQYGETLLEGLEIEHLVPDPNGTITADDIGDKELLDKRDESTDRFSIKLVPYGTDEFGNTRSQKARAMYKAWNTHKAGRARYAEGLFKKGIAPLKED
mmetsp:Transcript_20590/g.30372  ORF Transcript_20590/g.30372 Transcript_20590/m.30372 type:complete len:649 (-) Transcript_20590:47-1993(-)